MTEQRFDIQPEHLALVREILHRHVPQYDVWAFGSRVQGRSKVYSDLDLVIMTDKPLAIDVMAALADDFAESDLPWKVDIVDWATTDAVFRTIIERDRILIQTGTAHVSDGEGTGRNPDPTPL